jgi:deoxyribodipyrimidine photo-lyase
MAASSVIVWFRRDLRLRDNPAFYAASRFVAEREDLSIIPLYILDYSTNHDWNIGAASRWWLHHSLVSFQVSLEKIGGTLLIKEGSALSILEGLISVERVEGVFWNRLYDPISISRDQLIKARLQELGVHVRSFNGLLLSEPWDVTKENGDPYKVFTPFYKALERKKFESSLPVVSKTKFISNYTTGNIPINSLNLLPEKSWDKGFYDRWVPGEEAALNKLEEQITDRFIEKYGEMRNLPAHSGTSSLSPHLHFGEISVRVVWEQVHLKKISPEVSAVFLKELGWREFAYNLLFHFPTMLEQPLNAKFSQFPWDTNYHYLKAWQRGMTGYPIVDAGMRELWTTGWMHNRVRMIVGSFLVKHLLQSWQAGARWFWNTLVDADLASNTMGWQWIAGCGADAAPYFRIFNPVLQGEKFDPQGVYVRRWVPELSKLSNSYIHQPWNARPSDLIRAGVSLGDSYPQPIIEHGMGRSRALEAFAKLKSLNLV